MANFFDLADSSNFFDLASGDNFFDLADGGNFFGDLDAPPALSNVLTFYEWNVEYPGTPSYFKGATIISTPSFWDDPSNGVHYEDVLLEFEEEGNTLLQVDYEDNGNEVCYFYDELTKGDTPNWTGAQSVTAGDLRISTINNGSDWFIGSLLVANDTRTTNATFNADEITHWTRKAFIDRNTALFYRCIKHIRCKWGVIIRDAIAEVIPSRVNDTILAVYYDQTEQTEDNYSTDNEAIHDMADQTQVTWPLPAFVEGTFAIESFYPGVKRVYDALTPGMQVSGPSSNFNIQITRYQRAIAIWEQAGVPKPVIPVLILTFPDEEFLSNEQLQDQLDRLIELGCNNFWYHIFGIAAEDQTTPWSELPFAPLFAGYVSANDGSVGSGSLASTIGRDGTYPVAAELILLMQ